MLSLQAFVEKVTIFSRADSVVSLPDDVLELFSEYARHLADQGLFVAALKYCKGNSEYCSELVNRLYYGGGSECQSILAMSPPRYPFELVNVGVSMEARNASSNFSSSSNHATTVTNVPV